MKNKLYNVFYMMLVIIIMVSLFVISVSSEDYTTLTLKDAKSLVFSAVDFANHMYLPLAGDVADEIDHMKIDKYYYYRVIEENLPGESYEAMKEYAKTIFTDDIAPNLYSHTRNKFYNQSLFITENGKLYMANCDSSAYTLWWYTDLFDWSGFDIDDVTVKLVSSDSKKATALFKYSTEQGAYWIECYIVNTDNGWRIAESPFTHMLEWGESASDLWEDGVTPYDGSPSTGDANVSRVWWLAGVSLAALVPAALLVRRRREERF